LGLDAENLMGTHGVTMTFLAKYQAIRNSFSLRPLRSLRFEGLDSRNSRPALLDLRPSAKIRGKCPLADYGFFGFGRA
jgi:hypothetical protein